MLHAILFLVTSNDVVQQYGDGEMSIVVIDTSTEGVLIGRVITA